MFLDIDLVSGVSGMQKSYAGNEKILNATAVQAEARLVQKFKKDFECLCVITVFIKLICLFNPVSKTLKAGVSGCQSS